VGHIPIKGILHHCLLQDYTSVLKEQATHAGLTASDPWLRKVEQLFTMTQLKHGRHPLQCLSVTP